MQVAEAKAITAVAAMQLDELLAIGHTSGADALAGFIGSFICWAAWAEITHANLTSNLDALHTAWGWQADDLLLHVLPIFHVHGLFVALHGALNAGATRY